MFMLGLRSIKFHEILTNDFHFIFSQIMCFEYRIIFEIQSLNFFSSSEASQVKGCEGAWYVFLQMQWKEQDLYFKEIYLNILAQLVQ